VSRVFECLRLDDGDQAGLVSITIGLIAFSALIITRASGRDWSAFAVTAATFVLATRTRISPLVALAGAAPLGLAGLVH
jgi:chromate transporter